MSGCPVQDFPVYVVWLVLFLQLPNVSAQSCIVLATVVPEVRLMLIVSLLEGVSSQSSVVLNPIC